MIIRTWHIGLALLLAMLSRHFSIATVLAALGPVYLLSQAPRVWREKTLRLYRILRLARFLVDFVIDLTISNIRLAIDILTPLQRYRVQMVLVPIEDFTDREVLLLSIRITLTPGTLTCTVTEDRRYLLVHSMYLPEGESGACLRRPLDILKGRA